jgi:hypothetical protein
MKVSKNFAADSINTIKHLCLVTLLSIFPDSLKVISSVKNMKNSYGQLITKLSFKEDCNDAKSTYLTKDLVFLHNCCAV